MEDSSPQELLFWDLARKSTKICFLKCVGQAGEGLSGGQKVCVKDCVRRYLKCRESALETLKELAKRE